MSSTPLKKALYACRRKWPTGWKAVHLPGDTREDFALEMEIAEMMSGFEERQPEAYKELMRRQLLAEQGEYGALQSGG